MKTLRSRAREFADMWVRESEYNSRADDIEEGYVQGMADASADMVNEFRSVIAGAILALNHNSKEDVQKALRKEFEKYE